VIDNVTSDILSGKDLLNCISQRSLAPAEEIKDVVKRFDAQLFSNDQDLLMVKVPKSNVAPLNKALLAFGVEQRRAVVAGLPEKISRLPRDYDRQKLWEKIYGNQDIPELF
jgi:hypothetical protein